MAGFIDLYKKGIAARLDPLGARLDAQEQNRANIAQEQTGLRKQLADEALGKSLTSFQSQLGVDPNALPAPGATQRQPIGQQDPAALAMTLAQAEQAGGIAQIQAASVVPTPAQQQVMRGNEQGFEINAANERRAVRAEQRQIETFNMARADRDRSVENAITPLQRDFPVNAASIKNVMQVTSIHSKLLQVQKIYKDVGISGAVVALKDPAAAAILQLFRTVDGPGMLKAASGDSGVTTDSDFERYQGVIGVSLMDLMINDGEQAEAVVNALVADSTRNYNYLLAAYGDRMPDIVFETINYDNIGTDVTFEDTVGGLPELDPAFLLQTGNSPY